jgi:hypothetical protein
MVGLNAIFHRSKIEMSGFSEYCLQREARLAWPSLNPPTPPRRLNGRPPKKGAFSGIALRSAIP